MDIRNKVVILSGTGDSSKIVYNYIKDAVNVIAYIQEVPQKRIESIKRKRQFLLRRIKRLGLITVIGQILFNIIVAIPQARLSKKRNEEILASNGLDLSDVPNGIKRFTSKFNSDETIELLRELKPDLIVLNGTCIISQKVLDSVSCSFINTHAGITPKYRGVHGMYWALANNDKENAGVTVHFVDKGIDTGNVIYQARVEANKEDNFSTYFYLQITEGVKILKKAIIDYFNGTINPDKAPTESKLYSHPTLWKYLCIRLRHGVK